MLKKIWNVAFGGVPVPERVKPPVEDPLAVERRKPFMAYPFAVEYVRDKGQSVTHGLEDGNIVKVLEGVSGHFQQNVEVPALISDEKKGWLLCWGQPDHGTRGGAFKASGVTLSGNTDRYRQFWPALWPSFVSKETLNELTHDISDVKIDQLPPLPADLKTTLVNLYAKRFKQKEGHVFFSVNKEDLQSKLSWVWLLGPLDPTKSYLRPVSSSKIHMGGQAGYCPVWNEVGSEKYDKSSLETADQELIEEYFDSIIQLAQTDLANAIEEVMKLRSQSNYESLKTAMQVYFTKKQ